jgi:predicted RNase H-like HicB family nuclease
MKAADRYLKYVRWEADDSKYVGYCPDLFPWGGVCDGETEEAAYRELCRLVNEEADDLQREGKPLPAPETRPMREAMSGR